MPAGTSRRRTRSATRAASTSAGRPADASQLTDEDIGLANVILTNGARLYVDHAHPEYAGPECTGPLDVVKWDKAGERVMARAAAAVDIPGQNQIVLYKNNTDNKGVSYGTHENYLMRRETPFADIVRHLTPFFVTRQVVCGAGRVGIGQDGRGHGFQLSQRADFFEVEVGLETTLKRPIINTRDEPHADPEKYRRLHVIIGDANLAEISTYLKVGTTALVLAMIEDRALPTDFTIDGPVTQLHHVSHDVALGRLLQLTDGRQMTALDVQERYLEAARKFVAGREPDEFAPQTADVLERWESVLDRLRRTRTCAGASSTGSPSSRCSSPTATGTASPGTTRSSHLIDLQYADIRPEKGLYHRLVARGRMERLLDDDAVELAVVEPPEDTRAYFRGRCLAQYADRIAAASWDSVIFDLPGRDSLQRVPTMEPTARHPGARRRPARPVRHR